MYIRWIENRIIKFIMEKYGIKLISIQLFIFEKINFKNWKINKPFKLEDI